MTDQQRQQEAEATYFATCLLMPRPLVFRELARLQAEAESLHWGMEEIVQKLADLFHVSPERMALRVGEITAPT